MPLRKHVSGAFASVVLSVNGRLTNRETGMLEHDQARLAHQEARAGGHRGINRRQQTYIQHHANAQSRRIYLNKHDGRHVGRPGATP